MLYPPPRRKQHWVKETRLFEGFEGNGLFTPNIASGNDQLSLLFNAGGSCTTMTARNTSGCLTHNSVHRHTARQPLR